MNSFSRTVRSLFLVGISAALCCYGQPSATLAEDEAAVEFRQLEAAANATAGKLLKDTLAWTTEIDTQGTNARGIVEAVRSPTMRRLDVSVKVGDKVQFIVGIVERDGFWYVAANGIEYRCRPYEATFDLPSIYYFLERSELRFVPEASKLEHTTRVEAVEGGSAKLRSKLDPVRKLQFQAAIDNGPALLASSPDAAARRRITDRIAPLPDVIANGMPWSVNIETGIVVADGLQGLRSQVSDIAWVLPPYEDVFDVSGVGWENRAAPIAEDEDSRGDLIIIDHAPAWRPGRDKADSNTVLLDIKTGHTSRLPYAGSACSPGSACFSQDRTKVYVAGFVWDEGRTAVFEVDLLSGKQRRLSSPTLTGHMMSITLSPDGKTLAVANLAGTGQGIRILESQIYLIDIDSGDSTPMGKPFDTAFLSWLPAGNGLILVSRESSAPDKPPASTIVRMDLNGKIMPLLPGAFPYVMGAQERILFLDEAVDQWKTCNIEGADVQLIRRITTTRFSRGLAERRPCDLHEIWRPERPTAPPRGFDLGQVASALRTERPLALAGLAIAGAYLF